MLCGIILALLFPQRVPESDGRWVRSWWKARVRRRDGSGVSVPRCYLCLTPDEESQGWSGARTRDPAAGPGGTDGHVRDVGPRAARSTGNPTAGRGEGSRVWGPLRRGAGQHLALLPVGRAHLSSTVLSAAGGAQICPLHQTSGEQLPGRPFAPSVPRVSTVLAAGKSPKAAAGGCWRGLCDPNSLVHLRRPLKNVGEEPIVINLAKPL